LRRLALQLLITLFAAPLAAQVDLGPLFAPPTAAEIAAVRQDWASRTPTPTGWRVLRTGTSEGFTLEAVSHRIDGRTHYGAVRFPRGYSPGRRYPVLLYLHGGFDGLYVPNLVAFDAADPSGCTRDSFLVVAPAYRGEMLNGGSIIGIYTGDGPDDPFDTDCDDAMALLTAVLVNVPEARPAPVAVLGGSRGGNVAYHVALRDPRPGRVAVHAGPSDFFLAEVRRGAEQEIATGTTDDPLGRKVADLIAAPWLAGDLSLAKARLKLLSWCVVPFLDRPLALQLHHGAYDTVVPMRHTLEVDSLETLLGAPSPPYEFIVYPRGGHEAASLAGYAENFARFLCPVSRTTGVGLAPRLRSRLRAAPNPFLDSTLLTLREPAGGKRDASPAVGIYDLAGRHLRTLVLVQRSGDGVYGRRWDGRDARGRRVAPGIYLSRTGGAPAVSLKLVRLP